ncbi:CDP-alcohol phosphatidyltransferase family protein [Luteolibacter sp. AS25]|uniref:CDP-alcohol phosphatidyltransferase family protein n=1 Tax=Luteolibacter sp. AS25 TaxID=3135776 RepID=UPI00398ACC55
MTLATKITVFRICLVPVFVFYAARYGLSVKSGFPVEAFRYIALGTFIVAAISDGLDGWIARRFNQKSDLGAFLDPLADKVLVLHALMILTVVPWGPHGWGLPIWFITLVAIRDIIIIWGIFYLRGKKLTVNIRPHWTGKACTFSLFFVLGWVMLKIVPISPVYPCLVAGAFTLMSLVEYVQQGLTILRPKSA